jgi:hypothetical protein
MCFKMMGDAMQQSNSTDKAILMLMANQACQQASQTEQNADKNDDGNKLLTADDIPKQGSLTAGTFTLKDTMDTEAKLPNDVSADTAPPSSQGSDVPLVSPPSPDNYTLRTPTAAPENPAPIASFAPQDPTSPLKPIPPGSVNYDENASKGVAAASVGGGGFGMTRTLAQESGKADGTDKNTANAGESSKARKEGTGGGDSGAAAGGGPSGSGGGGGENEKTGGNEAFDALLAQMMGGGGGGGDMTMAGQDIVVLPPKQENTKLPNIFEFANWRYQKAAFEEGRVRPQAPKTPTALSETAKVARASKH